MSAPAEDNDVVQSLREAASPDNVDMIFAKIDMLKSGARRAVINEIERAFVAEWQETSNETGKIDKARQILQALDGLKQTPEGRAKLAAVNEATQNEILISQTLGQVFLNLSKEKGKQADPMVQAYVEEASKMSDQDYESFAGHTALMVKVFDRVNMPAAPMRKTNPFRTER